MGYKTYVKNKFLSLLMGENFLVRLPAGTFNIALTFDDGPDPTYTPKVLDVLKTHGAKATFFVIGSLAERHPEIIRRIVADGHALGNHSHGHRRFASLPLKVQLAQIEQTDRLLGEHVGHHRHWFRPPLGKLRGTLILALAQRRHGLAMWSYDSLDYKKLGTAAILSRFQTKPVQSGEIILFHDDNDFTVQALTALLPLWRGEGYKFEHLDRL